MKRPGHGQLLTLSNKGNAASESKGLSAEHTGSEAAATEANATTPAAADNVVTVRHARARGLNPVAGIVLRPLCTTKEINLSLKGAFLKISMIKEAKNVEILVLISNFNRLKF